MTARGGTHTEETRRKLSAMGMGSKNSGWGKKRSAETRKKMSLAKRGNKNRLWKGDKVGYVGLHQWVRRELGTPMQCEKCGTVDRRFYDWANKSGKYKRDTSDWIRLCRPCHRAHDKRYE